MLFVIDLTKLSWSKYDLLKKISNLENYCEKLGLELNFDKTKVMVFNKKGSTVKHEHKYTYLGFTFIPSGRKHKGIENLLKNAWKTWFAIQILFKSKKNTLDTYLRLIETIIKPIAL